MSLKVVNTIPDFERNLKKMKNVLPRQIANIAKNHYLEGFRRGGRQTDASRGGWKERKKKDKQKGRRAILVRTAALRNDIDVRRTTFKEIVLGTQDTTYGSYHNEGTEIHPQREFLGDSMILDKRILRFILNEFNKAFK